MFCAELFTGEKVVETLQLEDGTTAIVQSIPEKGESNSQPPSLAMFSGSLHGFIQFHYNTGMI